MDAGRRFVVFLAVLIAVGVAAAPASAGLGNDTSSELRHAVSAAKIKQHELALQLIGDLSGGNRLAGTKGYDRSAQYVAAATRLAGHGSRSRSSTTTSTCSRTGRRPPCAW